ncbi:MAG: type II toxin-antitoxin system YhaV family toxin [Candidimonas sp.]|nr:MAG: type II toxin-antitoxin system YhaV family toxin [Candidimonas sp.]TAM25508.1 MAG: type II toxin-antitoxin system YhaV family toxin [Candidimonas sp.]
MVVNGWTVYAHPLFLIQLEAIILQVEGLKQKDALGFTKKNVSKRLAAIAKLAFDVIPQGPSRTEYRQGNTLGEDYKHWFRAKFFQQYRLFFRYHAPSKLIVYAWVNDADAKRAYEGSNDAYRVFRKMREGGHPPDGWNQLLTEARIESDRLRRIAAGVAQECFRSFSVPATDTVNGIIMPSAKCGAPDLVSGMKQTTK